VGNELNTISTKQTTYQDWVNFFVLRRILFDKSCLRHILFHKKIFFLIILWCIWFQVLLFCLPIHWRRNRFELTYSMITTKQNIDLSMWWQEKMKSKMKYSLIYMYINNKYLQLMWGWVFFERTRILSGIQFIKHFIEFIIAETKQFVSSNVNVIMTRQACGQRSSRTAGSKRRARENEFPKQTFYMFLMSKCRGDWDLGLSTFWVLVNRELLRSGNFRKKNVFRPQEKSEFGIAQRFSFRKYSKSAQTWVLVSSTFWY